MQFPESWLREFCNPPMNTQQLADTLTMAGLEVEELRPVAPLFTGVVVGEIMEAQPHPNADRLRVCQVAVGDGPWLSIVCGAPNAREGIKVPCAMVGAQLPPGPDGKPFSIRVGKLRGVESHGMLCSARELGLSDDHGGLLELDGDAATGQDIRSLLGLDDTLFTLKLTPNLAHCLSVHGIARELAALTGAPLRVPPIESAVVQHQSVMPVRVLAEDLCGRFSGRIIRNINPEAKTPGWMVERLRRCGQRSVSALVDISNYVMFELGRPSHIFDLDRIHGHLEVRWARSGETLKLLNGVTVTLDERVGVIADEQAVESLAGIMGGDATAVSDSTRHIYVEAAFWWPKAIAGRSRRFNFSTDAGHRFERGVDPSTTVQHIERITQLILAICGGEPGPVDDQCPNMPVASPVSLRASRASKVIGLPLTLDRCASALKSLGLAVDLVGADRLTVTPPSFRFDLQIEEDLIEEVARMVGYDRLPDSLPVAPLEPRIRPEARRSEYAVRQQLADLGYQETINFSFVDESLERDLAGNADPIRLLNPIASQMNVMRSSLVSSLLQVVKFNTDRKAPRVRAFEVGRVFLRDLSVVSGDETVGGICQPMRVAGVAHGPVDALHWETRPRLVDFFDVKGDVQSLLTPRVPRFVSAEHPALHPGRSARVLVDGQEIGWIGELHPKWRQRFEWAHSPVLFELDLESVLVRPTPKARPIPRQQVVERDVAVVVAERVTHGALMDSIRKAVAVELLRDVVLFDVYRPKAGLATELTGAIRVGEKSLAVRLMLAHDESPLTDAQIDEVVHQVIQRLSDDHGARLRA